MTNCVAGVWDVEPRNRVRIAISSGKSPFRGVLWIEFGRDGSIYFGPRNPKYAYVKGTAKEMKDGEVFFSYDEGTPLSNEPLENVNKLSFHASGVINTFGRRSIRSSIRDIQKRELLCHFLPEKLSKFPLIEKQKKFDIGLNIPGSDERVLCCSIFIAPIDHALPPVEEKGALFQASVLLSCRSFENVQPLCVQLLFVLKDSTEFPPYTLIVWPAKEANVIKNTG
jgi:hypothetical protein